MKCKYKIILSLMAVMILILGIPILANAVEPSEFDPRPTKTGYSFAGWYTNPEFTGEPLTDESIRITMVHHPKWLPNAMPYLVRHWVQNLDADPNSMNSDNYSLKEVENLMSVSDAKLTPELKNYEGFTPKSVAKEIIVAADGSERVNYYYTRNYYTITYELNDGINGADPADGYMYGESIELPVATKDGFNFRGWYEEFDFSGDAVTNTEGMSGNKTFYAKWTSKDIPVIYDPNGGAFIDDIPVIYDPNGGAFTEDVPLIYDANGGTYNVIKN